MMAGEIQKNGHGFIPGATQNRQLTGKERHLEAMKMDLREKLMIPPEKVEAINTILTDPNNELVNRLLAVVDKHGGVDEINRKARENGRVDNLMARLEKKGSPYVKDLEWLITQRDAGAFIDVADYRKKVLGDSYGSMDFRDDYAVTLEISACQYFPWLMAQAKQAIANQELMPGRFIRVRKMAEQEEDNDVLAVAAAMQIIDSSWCETLDTKGTDGSNVHLGGPETITGYFGGVGQPNHYPIKWVDEFLHYYTNYGVKEVLNINPGTVVLGYLLHKLGIDNRFKISVFMGNDNPYSVFWTLMTAKLFSREDDTTSLIGFNFSNSVNNETIELSASIRKDLGFEDVVRFEHHILETYKSIVRQPYDRRAELVEVTPKVRNISAKHEGGDVAVEETREHPSDILDYFQAKEDIIEQGVWDAMCTNYLDKHNALNNTARALTENGLSFIAAQNLHK